MEKVQTRMQFSAVEEIFLNFKTFFFFFKEIFKKMKFEFNKIN